MRLPYIRIQSLNAIILGSYGPTSHTSNRFTCCVRNRRGTYEISALNTNENSLHAVRLIPTLSFCFTRHLVRRRPRCQKLPLNVFIAVRYLCLSRAASWLTICGRQRWGVLVLIPDNTRVSPRRVSVQHVVSRRRGCIYRKRLQSIYGCSFDFTRPRR